ncbi:hypothetical protein GCM10028807_36470 [Spirosoma daeguense]
MTTNNMIALENTSWLCSESIFLLLLLFGLTTQDSSEPKKTKKSPKKKIHQRLFELLLEIPKTVIVVIVTGLCTSSWPIIRVFLVAVLAQFVSFFSSLTLSEAFQLLTILLLGILIAMKIEEKINRK